MKKGLILVLFALVSVVSYSQVSWNVKAGMNMSNITKFGGDMKIGYNVGVGMEYAFSDMWSIQPSLLFTAKGTKASFGSDKLTINPLYLELPIMAAARFAVSDNMNIVVSAGPYFAYGVGGKISGGGESTNIFGTGSEVKRFDAGLGVGVAWEINKFFVGVNGEFGLTKLYALEGSPKNTNFSIGVGYKF